MKKIIFSGFMGALLSVPAFAAGETSLTTKGYVDDGLRAVYNASKSYTDSKVGDSTTGLTKDVNDLKSTVGDGSQQNPGLVGDVAALDDQINGTNGLADDVTALQTTVGNTDIGQGKTVTSAIAELQSSVLNDNDTTYAAGTGITISGNNNAVSITGLDASVNDNTNMYVYKEGQLVQMPVVSSWSTDGLTF